MNPNFDPYDMLQQTMIGIAEVKEQQAMILKHLAGLSQNQTHLVNMYDELHNRLNLLEMTK
jgi:hypothetical protein